MKDADKQALLEWWQCLDEDRGSKAELRRARCPNGVVFSPAYHRLYMRLHWPENDRDKLAAIAGLAAHVKEHSGTLKFAEQMALPKCCDSTIVSGLRFRRILAIEDLDELYRSLIRVLRMLGGKANLLDLAESLYWWNKRTKKDWAYRYFARATADK